MEELAQKGICCVLHCRIALGLIHPRTTKMCIFLDAAVKKKEGLGEHAKEITKFVEV